MGELSSALLQGLILLLLLAVVFPGVFLRGEAISPSDMLGSIPPWCDYVDSDGNGLDHKLMSDVITAFHPYYALVRAALDRGEWPLWNHLEYGGMPLLANCQSTVFYPPRLLHAFMDVRVATTFYIILKLWLCGMVAYACARGIRINRDAARFFSAGWTLASYNLIWANWSLPDVSVWVPLLFLAIELLLDGRYRRGFFAMLAGGSLIFLAGHPETALTMCLGLGLYFALRLVLDGRRGRRLWAPLGVGSAAAALSLLICMPVVLPFIEYLLNSHTFYARAEKLQYPLNPGAVVSFWLPRFFGASIDKNFWGSINSNLISMFYPGIAVWAGISLLITKRPRSAPVAPPDRFAWIKTVDHRAAAILAVSLLMVLLAFDAPGVRALNRLPVMSSTLICYHASFAFFGLPLLAALGIDRFMSQRRRLRELVWLLVLAGVAACLLAYEYRFSSTLIGMMKLGPYIQRQLIVAGLMAAGSLIMLAGFCLYPNRTLWVSALTVMLAADLIYANRGLNPTMPVREVFPETKLTQHLRSLGDHRIGFPEGNIPSGLMAPYGLEDWQAYDGLYPQRMWRFTNDMAKHLWGRFEPLRSIQYYLNDPKYAPSIPAENLAKMEPVAPLLDGLQILKNPNALPRAYLVPRIEAMPDASNVIEKLSDPSFDPRETVLTEAPPSHALPTSNIPAAELGTARVTYRGGTSVVIEAEAKAGCALVLSDAYYPGWTATIDGEETQIFPAYSVFRGICLPTGRHQIAFTYMPATFKAGMAASITTLIAISLGILLTQRR